MHVRRKYDDFIAKKEPTFFYTNAGQHERKKKPTLINDEWPLFKNHL